MVLRVVQSRALGIARFDGHLLRRWTLHMLAAVDARNYDLTVRCVPDGAMRRLNARYRGVDAVTDVLSFPAIEVGRPLKLLLNSLLNSTPPRLDRRA